MKQKIYVNKKEIKKNNIIDNLNVEILIDLLIYSVALLIAAEIFSRFYIENILYAFIAALIISLLNEFLKPFLQVITLPITIASYGLLLPLTNVIILELTSLLLGGHFYLHGILTPFCVSIVISLLNYGIKKIIKKEGGYE